VRFLFVHQNFPGQFLHILRRLIQSGDHEILFICEPSQGNVAGVRQIPYTKPQIDNDSTHLPARELENGTRRAEAVFRAAWGLRYLGFEPDIIIGHHGWGEMLSLRDVWPKAPMLGYFEFYYHHDGGDVGFDPEFPSEVFDFARIRAKNAINHLALNLGGAGQCPTQWQLSTYPDWAREQMNLIWEGVHLDICSPDPLAHRRTLKVGDMEIKPTDKLITYLSRDLEPYRGFHSIMRALPDMLKARKDLKVVLIGADGVSYGAPPAGGGGWRDVMMKEVGKGLDMDRVVFPGRVPYELYINCLRRSDAHVYLTYPFVASWSLRESLAIGCPVVGSDTPPVSEFITHGENGILVPFLEPKAIAQDILALLENKDLTQKIKANARAYAEKHLSMEDYLTSYAKVIETLTGQDPVANYKPAAPAKKPKLAAGKPAALPKTAKPSRAARAPKPPRAAEAQKPPRAAEAQKPPRAAKAPKPQRAAAG
jgi:glycosyltransferase involved in cell wall biosynthesis